MPRLRRPAGPLDRLADYHRAARSRVETLREQLATAEGFARQMQEHLAHHTR